MLVNEGIQNLYSIQSEPKLITGNQLFYGLYIYKNKKSAELNYKIAKFAMIFKALNILITTAIDINKRFITL